MGMDPVTEPSEALGSPVPPPPPPPTVLEPLIGYPLRTGSAVTLEQPLPISTDGEAGQALEAGEGYNRPEGTDGPGPGVVGTAAAFQDFMEEVHSFWDRPASAPSVLKQVAPLVSLEGSDKLGLVGFPPVDHHCGLGQGSASGGLTQGPCVPEPAMQGHGDAPEVGLCSRSTAFQDFMEEVHSFWDRPASAPSVLKQVAPLVSLEGSDKLGLVGFPPVDHHCGLGQGSASGGLTQGPCVPEPAMQGHGDAPEAGLCSGSTGDQPREYGEYPDRLYGWHTMGSPTP
ncbi:UNVERIFIED_CONTAM: hypothetical protein FKN15_042539 [Acipenser sinensis]